MRILVDTGVFSASISPRRRARFEPQIGLMAGQHIFLAAGTALEQDEVRSDEAQAALAAAESA